jgi:hypothetical protein
MSPRYQTNRWKYDRPPSLLQFMATFPDDAACAEWLTHRRWPDGFVCPVCSGLKGCKLEAKPWTWECAGCGRQTSTTAGTMMHRTHLPLRTWFLAAHLVATHSNGISALQLQAKLGIGSYKTAWLLLHKLRKAMVDPERDPLEGMVEVDESSIVYRTKDDPVAGGQGRSAEGKILIAAAVETLPGGRAGRIRLTTIKDYSATTLQRFVADNTVDGSTILTDGFSATLECAIAITCREWSARWPPIRFCRGSTGCSQTSSGWRSASIMGSAASIFRLISTSSCSAGTGADTTGRRSRP